MLLIPKHKGDLSPDELRQRKTLPACCADRSNVITLWPRADLRLVVCKTCGHKYYRFFTEPGSLGAMLRGA